MQSSTLHRGAAVLLDDGEGAMPRDLRNRERTDPIQRTLRDKART